MFQIPNPLAWYFRRVVEKRTAQLRAEVLDGDYIPPEPYPMPVERYRPPSTKTTAFYDRFGKEHLIV